MITQEEITSILFKSGRKRELDELDFEDDAYTEEYSEPFEYKDKYYTNAKTKKTIRLYARTWKFGKDPMDKNNLWKISIQPVEKGVVIAEKPIHTDWCEKDKVFEYIPLSPVFSGYKEMKSVPKRKTNSKKRKSK